MATRAALDSSLSAAIRRGNDGRTWLSWFDDCAPDWIHCPLSAVHMRMFGRPPIRERELVRVLHAYGCETWEPAILPDGHVEDLLFAIYELADNWHWTKDEIADWLEEMGL